MLSLLVLSLACLAQGIDHFPQLNPKPTRQLLPAIHWDNDFSDLKHLVPKMFDRLYYADASGLQDAYRAHRFGDVEAGFKHPTVMLEKSKHVSMIDCTTGAIKVTFDDNKSFNLVRKEWSKVDTLLVGTFAKGCGNARDRRSFWRVDDMAFISEKKGGVVRLMGDEYSAKMAIQNASMKWGRYDPPKVPRSPHARMDKRFSIVDFDNSTFGTISFNSQDAFPPSDDSPWGPAYELYSASAGNDTTGTASLAVYCVDCGFSESLTFSGSAKYDVDWTHPWGHVTELAVAMDGNMHIGMGIGMVASYEYTATYEKDLATFPLYGISFEDLVTVGATCTVSMKGDFTFNAKGQLLMGAALDWPSVHARLDILDSGNSEFTGWEPTPSTQFDTSDQIGVTVGAGLPVELGLEVAIPPVDFKEELGIVDTPGLQMEATYDIAQGTSCDSGGGVNWDVKFVNDVTGDIFGNEIDINHYESGPIFDGCVSV